jgi:NADH pyrophosphatase NudC (nudix superfamily)
MAFLDKVSDLGKTAAKKSGEMFETTKINLKINEEKSKIKDVEIELGKYIYNQYLNGAEFDADAKEMCVKMKGMYENIEELARQRDEVGQKDSAAAGVAEESGSGKFCPHCGAKQSGESKFCGSCGGKLEG